MPSGWDVWNGQAGTNNWNTGGNWSLGHAPGPSDYVLIEDAMVTDDLGQNDADQSITQLHLVSSGMASGPILDITNFAADSRTFTITGAPNADGNRVALSNTGSITIENQNLSEDGNQVSTDIPADIQGTVQRIIGEYHDLFIRCRRRRRRLRAVRGPGPEQRHHHG